MSPVSRLKFHLIGLQMLVWLQRSLRLVLRAIWLGIGGVLFAWGCNQLWGWVPDVRAWLWVGSILAGAPLLLVPVSYPRRKSLFWAIDQRFRYKEQISTSWQELASGHMGLLQETLYSDVQVIINRLRWRILVYGWGLGRDLLALLIVGGLAYIVYQSYYLAPASIKIVQGVQVIKLPPLGIDATAEQIFPEGLIAFAPLSSGEASNSLQNEVNPQSEVQDLTEKDMASLDRMLQSLGQSLSQETATHQISQGLQSRNLEQASTAVETLADQVEGLREETQRQLAQAMQEAANSLNDTNLQALQDDLQQAAESLFQKLAGDSTTSPALTQIWAKEQIDQVASDLRAIAEQTQYSQSSNLGESVSQEGGAGAGTAVGSREKGNPEDFNRLAGEGETMEFEALSEDETGFLTPGDAERPGSSFSQSGFSGSSTMSDQIVDTYIIPFYYPWKWRYVVSTYFQKR